MKVSVVVRKNDRCEKNDKHSCVRNIMNTLFYIA